MPVLYHYTAPFVSHLGSILSEGTIRTTESNLSAERADAGSRVVWLTDTPTLDGQTWMGQSETKALARLTVDVDAESWPSWAREHGVEEDFYERLALDGDPERWFVRTRPIHRSDIIALHIAAFDGKPPREFEGQQLKALFTSAARRRALELPKARVVRYRG
jgi:hypothetical protein